MNLVILSLSNLAVAQSNEDMAKAYFLDAKDAYSNGKCIETQSLLDKSTELLEGSNATIEALRIRCYVHSGNYDEAKKSLDRFFKFGTSNAALEKEMLSYVTRVENLLDEERLKRENANFREVERLTQFRNDSTAYANAVKLNTVDAYALYLSGFRNGIHKVEARRTYELLKSENLESQEKAERARLYEESKKYVLLPGELIPYYEDGKWGYFVKSTGYRWIEAKYTSPGIFKNGIAIINIDDCSSQIIDVNGEVVKTFNGHLVESRNKSKYRIGDINGDFQLDGHNFSGSIQSKLYFHDWSESWEAECIAFYPYCSSNSSDSMAVYFTKTKNVVNIKVYPKYDSGGILISDFKQDYIQVLKGMIIVGEKLYDLNGVEITGLREADSSSWEVVNDAVFGKYANEFWSFQTLDYFNHVEQNTPVLLRKTDWAYKDKKDQSYRFYSPGNESLNRQSFTEATHFSEGLAAVAIDKKHGYINSKGEIVIPCIYRYALPFSDGVANVMLGNKWYYIDSTGSFINDLKYRSAYSFTNGYSLIQPEKYGQFHIQNKKGEIIHYDIEVHGGIYEINNKLFLYSSRDNMYHFSKDEFSQNFSKNHPHFEINKGKNYAIHNTIYSWSGEVLTTLEIDENLLFNISASGGHFIVQYDKYKRLINENGETILSPKYYNIFNCSNSVLCALIIGDYEPTVESIYEKMKFFDESGKLLQPRSRVIRFR